MKQWLREQFRQISFGRGKWIGSSGIAAGHLALAFVYMFPELGLGPTSVLPVGAVSVVNSIDNSGPWWPAAFGLPGLAIAAGLIARRGLQWAHALGATGCGAYATAAILGARMSDPGRPIVLGIFAAIAAIIHWGLSESYGDMVAAR